MIVILSIINNHGRAQQGKILLLGDRRRQASARWDVENQLRCFVSLNYVIFPVVEDLSDLQLLCLSKEITQHHLYTFTINVLIKHN